MPLLRKTTVLFRKIPLSLHVDSHKTIQVKVLVHTCVNRDFIPSNYKRRLKLNTKLAL